MKRRMFVTYASAGFAAALGTGLFTQPGQAQSANVTIQYLGHTCFLFSSGGRRILVNPFRPIGCTAGYRPPNVNADLVMISSRLFDEGSVEGLPGNPRLLAEAGDYDIGGQRIQGIQIAHDREGGRRFGFNIIWRWDMGGLNITHMGGAAAPVEVEQQILVGRPDVMLVPVGGGPKAYTPEEASAAIDTLNPRIIIPTHYRTSAADPNACDISPLDDFLTLMQGTPVQRQGNTWTVSPGSLPSEGRQIVVMSYPT
ncbi:MBL fold metallo-hydrolase [Vacuolonema iberomarrocanum]|uniref:MBL fold metallo-hydrolase n=1 Tax=Vacuolonema iberomarrocanum TaxID=3454632 RepID=UPI0019E50719|nr:MBL fold metallo-hydrolase [filamentous cyanobacterium LEGE 07170]